MEAEKQEEIQEEIQEEKSRGRPKKRCKFVGKKIEQIPYTDKWGKPRTQLKWKDLPCEAAADGLNGYCKSHTYPVMVPVAKLITRKVIENVETSAGVMEAEVQKSENIVWNVGEHLPMEHFTDAEIQALYQSGQLGIRITEDVVRKVTDFKSLTSEECDAFMERSHAEILAILSAENYDKETVSRLLARAKAKPVQDELRKQLEKLG